MVRGESRAGCNRRYTALVEDGAGGIVRALSDGHGALVPQSADAGLVGAGADADRKYAQCERTDLACDAGGEPVPRLLAQLVGTRLAAGSIGGRRCRSGAGDVRRVLQVDLN